MYSQYCFSGGKSNTYSEYLTRFSEQIIDEFDSSAEVLEIGAGDGHLLKCLHSKGYRNVLGLDPSLAKAENVDGLVRNGFFPEDLPNVSKKFDLIVCRHVLEHIDTPRDFLCSASAHLKDEGEVWLEVPDLASTFKRKLWSNFYQLQCNYFDANSLDAMCSKAGLAVKSGTVVDIFGGLCYDLP